MYYADRMNTSGTAPDEDNTIPVFARWFGSWRISVQRRAMSTPQLARFYDLAAPAWSRKLDRIGFPEAYEEMLRRVVASDNLVDTAGSRRRVLDCGTGTGAMSRALAKVLRAPFSLDAIDISPVMLDRADENLRSDGIEVALRQGDMRRLPYRDAAFDIVMTAHVLEHLPDPDVALREMVRVLKPGGLLIACITRRSALGAYVQLKWRTHRVTAGQAERWLSDSGLQDTRSLAFGAHALCRQMSVACIGRKPEI